MKTIELNEQQVEVLKTLLESEISPEKFVSRFYYGVVNQILDKLNEND